MKEKKREGKRSTKTNTKDDKDEENEASMTGTRMHWKPSTRAS